MTRALGAAVAMALALATVGLLRLSAPPPAIAPMEGRADEVLGINEAVSVPLRLVQREELGVEALSALFQADARATAALGARWVRAHSAVPPRLNLHDHLARGGDFSVADAWLRAVQAEGLEVVIMLSPWPGNRTAAYTEDYVVADPEAYARFLRAVVERYDGDGVDDMPGLLRPVRHWEIDNEPDLKHTTPPRGGPKREDFCTPEQYAEVLRVSAAAIREAQPDAVILNGGFYRPMTGPGQRYMEAVLRQPGVLEAIDVLSIHAYSSGPDLERITRAVEAARELAPEHPIWLTETSLPSAGEEDWLSEDWQAEMVLRLHAEALRLGVERVFWHTLADPPEDAPGRSKGPGMRHNALMATLEGGEKQDKPAAVAYRRLAALLAEVPRAEVTVTGGRVQLGQAELVLEGTVRSGEVTRMRDGAPVRLPADADEAVLLLSAGG